MLHVSQFLTDSLLNEQLTERYVQDASGHRSPDPFFNSWRLKWLVHTRIYRPSHHLRHYSRDSSSGNPASSPLTQFFHHQYGDIMILPFGLSLLSLVTPGGRLTFLHSLSIGWIIWVKRRSLFHCGSWRKA